MIYEVKLNYSHVETLGPFELGLKIFEIGFDWTAFVVLGICRDPICRTIHY